MRRLCKIGLVFGVVFLLAGSVTAQQQRQQGQGQRGQGRGGMASLAMYLDNEGVQKELKLDKDQTDKAKEVGQKAQDKQRENFAKLQDLSPEERGAKVREMTRASNEETLKAVGAFLKPDQVKRLKQIEMQSAGGQAFARAEVQQSLNLTSEQKEKIKTINDNSSAQLRELFQPGGGQGAAEKVVTLRKETTEKISAVLTDDQKNTWKKLTGEPYTVQFQGRRRGNG